MSDCTRSLCTLVFFSLSVSVSISHLKVESISTGYCQVASHLFHMHYFHFTHMPMLSISRYFSVCFTQLPNFGEVRFVTAWPGYTNMRTYIVRQSKWTIKRIWSSTLTPYENERKKIETENLNFGYFSHFSQRQKYLYAYTYTSHTINITFGRICFSSSMHRWTGLIWWTKVIYEDVLGLWKRWE